MQSSRFSPPSRGAFTLVELMVVMAIIAVLASLILPAVQSARETGRRTECMSNQSQLAKAVYGFAGRNNDRFPLFRGERLFGDAGQVTVEKGNSSAPRPRPIAWPIALFPDYDSRALRDRLLEVTPAMNDHPNDPNSFHQLKDLPVGGLSCPDDPTADIKGNLSYVVNLGWVDHPCFLDSDKIFDGPPLGQIRWNITDASGNQAERVSGTSVLISTATAVFLPNTLRVPDGTRTKLILSPYSQRMNDISTGDGASYTLMITENLQATSWHDESLGGSSFVSCLAIRRDFTPLGFGKSGGGPGQALAPNGPIDGLGCLINDNLGAPEGNYPRPSSLHPGGVVGAFVDGHVAFINESIDTYVYYSCLTPKGTFFGETVNTYTGN